MSVSVPVRAARPHLIRAAAAGIVAVAGLIVASLGSTVGRGLEFSDRLPVYIGAGLMAVGGIGAVRALSSAIKKVTEARTGDTRGSSLALIAQAVGYVVVALAVLGVMQVPLQGFLLGGALTGVILGLAAQQVLANFFAGIVLAVLRPMSVGETVLLKSGPLGGEYEGVITDMTLFYVKMLTATGPVDFPNAAVLGAAVGPGARSATDDKEPGEGTDSA